MEDLIKRVLREVMASNNIVIFCDLSVIEHLTISITDALPLHFNATIDIQPITNSTKYLKGHKFCISFFHESCFQYITPTEFLDTHYVWLKKQVSRLYGKQNEICQFFSVEDAFQEICLHYLDKILAKYDGKSNLRSFVANRLRWYFKVIVDRQLRIRKIELEYILMSQSE